MVVLPLIKLKVQGFKGFTIINLLCIVNSLQTEWFVLRFKLEIKSDV